MVLAITVDGRRLAAETPTHSENAIRRVSFECEGDKRLEQFIVHALRSFPPTEREAIRARLMQQPRMDVGTWCSGTDAPVLMSRAFAEAARSSLQCSADVRHAFSCECNVAKQQFLLDMVPVPILFDDAYSLPKLCGFNVKGSTVEPVPTISRAWFGFPCQDVSSLNMHAKSHGAIVEAGTLRTGGIFRASCDYIGKITADLDLVIAENVMGLQAHRTSDSVSNLDTCISCLEQLGMYVIVFYLCPSYFNKPVTRRRVWILSIPLRLAQYVEKDILNKKAEQLMQIIMKSALKSEMGLDLDYHLLPEGHPSVQEHMWRLRQRRGRGRNIGTKQRWLQRHEEWCHKQGRDWVGIPVGLSRDLSLIITDISVKNKFLCDGSLC